MKKIGLSMENYLYNLSATLDSFSLQLYFGEQERAKFMCKMPHSGIDTQFDYGIRKKNLFHKYEKMNTGGIQTIAG